MINDQIFETKTGTLEEMETLLRAVLWLAPVWEGTLGIRLEAVEFVLGYTLMPARIFHLRSAGRNRGTREIPWSDFQLIKYIVRFFAPRVRSDVCPKHNRNLDLLRENFSELTHCDLALFVDMNTPTQHEKLEALALLNDWLRDNWPEGETHLRKVVENG